MKVEIKNFEIGTVAKISGIIGLFVGALAGIFYSIYFSYTFGIIWGLIALIAVPAGYGLMGFIFGALYAWLYNLAAGKIGGIKLQCKKG